MILVWLMGAAFVFVGWLVGLVVPSFSIPQQVAFVHGVGDLAAAGWHFNRAFPLSELLIMTVAFLQISLGLAVVRIARWLVGWIPTMGGGS